MGYTGKVIHSVRDVKREEQPMTQKKRLAIALAQLLLATIVKDEFNSHLVFSPRGVITSRGNLAH